MEPLKIIRPELLSFTEQQLALLGPYAFVLVGAILAIIFSVLPKINPKWPVFLLSILTLIGGMVVTLQIMGEPSTPLFNAMMVVDRFSNVFNLLFLASALFTIFASIRYLDREDMQHPEYYILILFAVLGMMFMTASLDLIVLFVALELMSLTVYTLVGFRRSDRKSNEAALKYFILGGAASAILLYGTALLYGQTNSTNIKALLEFAQTQSSASSFLFALGGWLVIVGFLFKVASVPFHMWMPDVYEGAPAPITGFMTTGLKAASFAAFVRVFVSLGFGKGLAENITMNIHNILWICAVLTMVIGNVVALTQVNLKRLLAYSSIAHTGYLMVGLIAGYQNEEGFAPIIVYLIAYSLMNLGAFIILSVLAKTRDGGLNLQDLAGLSKRHPWLAFAMAVFMFSMAGIPMTAGFIGKYLLFYSAIQAGETLLVVISVLCSAISVYYYLRVLVYMYMRESQATETGLRIPLWSAIALATMVVLTLQVGLLPGGLLQAAKNAVAGL